MHTPYSPGLRRLASATVAAVTLSAGPVLAQIGVQVNGTPVRFGAVGPLRVEGRVMIPLRSVGEALGAELEWQAATRTVRGAKGGKTSELSVSSRTALVGGRTLTLDVPAAMERGTVLVPLRFVAEALGAEVEWRAAEQQVLVATAGDAGPPPGAVPGTVTGEILSVDETAKPPTLTVRAQGIRQTLPLARGAIILRGAVGTPGIRSALGDLRPGDTAQVRVDDATGAVTVVEAQFRGAPGVEPPPGEAPAVPQIRSFVHNASGPLRAGSVVELTLVGTPGGTAAVDIGSVARDVPLREDPARPGRYSGRFTVPAGIAMQDVPVLARLEQGGKQAPLVQSGAALSIDAQPPRISGAAPAGETRIANQRPNIYVNLDDQGGTGVDAATFRMTVRGRDITPDVKVTPTFAIYTPETLSPGPVPVEVEVKDAAGNTARAAWTFTLGNAETLIRSVTHNADKPLRAGDVLTVQLVGRPGGQASFDVGEVAQGLPLREETPGNYVGTYTVRQGDQSLRADVTAHLRVGDQRASQSATAPVPVVTQPLSAPRVLAPKAGETVASGFVVTGQAAPGSKVNVEVTFSGRAFGLLAMQGSAGAQEVTTDEKGEFRTKPFAVELPLGLSRADVQIRAAVLDPSGRRSDPTSVTVKLR